MWKTLVNAVTGLLGNGIQNAVNVKQQQATNKHNEKLVQLQNQAAAQQADLSYQRSRADNQVANMMNAGMSRAGAINALNGGGHYQPAPVNTSQANAPQIDTSSAINAIQAATQLAENKRQFDKGNATQRDMQDKQISSTERMHKAQLESNERIAQIQSDASKYGADLGFEGTKYSTEAQKYIAHLKHLEFIEELQFKQDDLQFRKDQYEYGKKLIDAQTDLTIAQKDDIKAKLDEWKSEPAKTAREAKYQLDTLAAKYNYRVTEAELSRYLHDYFYYDKDKDKYVPKIQPNLWNQGAHSGLENATKIAKDFWDLVLTIIPIKPLLDSFNLFGK